ncbi:FecR family protein [Zhouia sp. PK063]|uniref:FecR family protein n=1 Tax=Zhouia sp. PK063 TaxID=3373602 RepID=UPI0037920C22
MKEVSQKELKVVRYITGEMSVDEKAVFEIELSIDDSLHALFIAYTFVWDSYPTDELPLEKEKFKKRIAEYTRLDEKKIRKRKKRIICSITAACATVCIGLGVFLNFRNNNYYNYRSAGLGERLTVFLPDSSKVILNAGSEIKYSNDFKNAREVWLKGEAFFDVKHLITSPFLVHTGNLNVKVLGTAFNVNASKEKNSVSLQRGKVHVSLPKEHTELNLLPNEELIFNTHTKETIKRNFNPDKVLAWKDNILLLDSISFQNALQQINTFYGVTFSIADHEVGKQKITGVFKDQNLEDFISSLEFITNVKITETKPHHYLIAKSNE